MVTQERYNARRKHSQKTKIGKRCEKKGGTNRKEQEKEQTNEQKKKGARTSEKTDRTNKRENR